MAGLFPACKQESQLNPDSIKTEEEANKLLECFLWCLPSVPGLLTRAPTYTDHLSQSLLSFHYRSFLHSMKSLAQPAEGFLFGLVLFFSPVKS